MVCSSRTGNTTVTCRAVGVVPVLEGYQWRHRWKGAVATGETLLVHDRDIRNEGMSYKSHNEMEES